MNFTELQNNVQNSMGGRTDIPDFVYELTTAALNRDLRMMEMEKTVDLTFDAEFVDLPSDFQEVITVYFDPNGQRINLQLYTPDAINFRRGDTGQPWGYALTHNPDTAVAQVKLIPSPDGSYDGEMRYYAALPELSESVTTNVALARYPALYMYGSLYQAALWAQDESLGSSYNALYLDAMTKAQASEIKRRTGGPIFQRAGRDLNWRGRW